MTLPPGTAVSHGRDPAIAVAHAAMEAMLRHGVSPTPPHYQLFFACQLPGDLPWRAEFEELLARRAPLDALYDRVFSPMQEHGVLCDVSHRLGATLSEASQAMRTAAGDADRYGQTLHALTDALTPRGTAVPPHIVRLQRETRALQEKNGALSRSLAAMAERTRALRAELDAVRREALSDPLTKLANRRAFEAALEKALGDGGDVALALLDLDHFKAVNDTHGHAVGDRVLAAVAGVLQAAVAAGETAARVGGEEMALILRRDGAATLAAAQQIRQAVAGLAVADAAGQPSVRVTTSIGVARARAGEPPDALLARADQLLYAAKQAGRNCVRAEADAEAMAW